MRLQPIYYISILFLLFSCGPSQEEINKSKDEKLSFQIKGKWFLCAHASDTLIFKRDSCTFMVEKSPADENELYGEVHAWVFKKDSVYLKNIPFTSQKNGNHKVVDPFNDLYIRLSWNIHQEILSTSSIRKYKILKLDSVDMMLLEEK